MMMLDREILQYRWLRNTSAGTATRNKNTIQAEFESTLRNIQCQGESANEKPQLGMYTKSSFNSTPREINVEKP